jgi:hypothetical protein
MLIREDQCFTPLDRPDSRPPLTLTPLERPLVVFAANLGDAGPVYSANDDPFGNADARVVQQAHR